MKRSRPKKAAVFFFILTFMALYSPRLLADTSNTGKFTGFIYKADRTSPFEKAFVQLQNVATGSVHKSTISDAFGAFRIDEIERGLYIVSVRTEEGYFKSRNIIGIRENETARAAFALKLLGMERKENIPVGTAEVIASSEPVIYDYRVLATDPPVDPPDDPPGPPVDPPDDPPGPPVDPPDDPPGPPVDPPDDPPGPPVDPPDVPPGPPVDPPEPDPSPHKPAK